MTLPDPANPLSEASARAAFSAILDGSCSAEEITKFLVDLADRGETATEIAAAATEMRERLSSVEAERDRLSAENEELKGSLSSRSDELENLRDVAADPIRLDQANRRLNEELSMLRSELDQVKAENAMLRGNNTSQQWITGVGILILGAIAGLLLKSKSGRRRSTWAN